MWKISYYNILLYFTIRIDDMLKKKSEILDILHYLQLKTYILFGFCLDWGDPILMRFLSVIIRSGVF